MINYEFPPLGGGNRHGLCCAPGGFWQNQNLHVELVTSSSHRQVQCRSYSERINIHFLPTPKQDRHYWRMSELFGWTMQALGYASALTRAQRFDLCHCWGGWPSGIVGLRLARRQPYIVSLRGSDVPGYNKRLRVLDPLVVYATSLPTHMGLRRAGGRRQPQSAVARAANAANRRHRRGSERR